jgi:hypothetical protein
VGRLVDVDTTAWPLVVFRFPRRLHIEAVDDFLAGADAVLERRERFATLIDTTALEQFPTATERHHLVSQMNLRTFAERTLNLGNGVVIVSAPARAVLTAINWIRPPVTPQLIAGSYREALEWCCARLAGAGIALSPPLAELRAKLAASR